ncbi:MAG TPA: TIR domain-containing protein, partial [Gaiellaceae bacterium]|nr:TIR domain-containing protein [Gaiellaceae bacterium]
MLSRRTRNAPEQGRPAHDRPDVFLSYSRVDKDFAEGRLTKALDEHGKDVWIDVEDIRGGAADWRATVYAGIESAKVVVFVLTPESLASTVCSEELAEAERLNKRVVPVLHRSVKDLPIPEALSRPNWVYLRPEDDFEASVEKLIAAIELDEPWVEQHARLTQRTGEWLRHDRNGSYLLRGSDLRDAEQWLDDQAGHDEAPTVDQITYITASRRAATRRLRGLLAGVGVALLITAALAIAAVIQRQRAIDREKTARAQARAAQSIAALSRDPEESVRDALAAVEIRPNLPEAIYALRRAVSAAGWTSILRLPDARDVRLLDVEFSDDGRRVATGSSDGRAAVWNTRTGRLVTVARTGGAVNTVQFSPDGGRLLTASTGGVAATWNSSTGKLLRTFDTRSEIAWSATWGDDGRRILTAGSKGGDLWDAATGRRLRHLESTNTASQGQGAIKMSLDGRRALTAAANGDAWLWNLRTGAQTRLRTAFRGYPLGLSLLSDDGRRFATFQQGGPFCVWDDGRTKPRLCIKGTSSTDADLSRDGRRVLRADAKGIVSVWDVAGADPRPIARLPNGGSVSTAQFSRDGRYVVTGSDDGFARIWQVKPTRLVALLRGHTRGVQRARFSPDGSVVATVSDDGSGRLWPAQPNTPDDPAWQSAESTSFGPNSRDVLVVRGRRRAIWNTRTGDVVDLDEGGIRMQGFVQWPCGHAAGCSPWSPKGRLVAGANARGGAVIWDPRTGHVVRRFGRETRTVAEAAFSPDGRELVVVDTNRPAAQIWDVRTAERVGAPMPKASRDAFPLSAARFLSNPPRILTVDVLGTVRVSDPTTRTSATLPGAAFPAA